MQFSQIPSVLMVMGLEYVFGENKAFFSMLLVPHSPQWDSPHKISVWPELGFDSRYGFKPFLSGFGSVLRIIHCERFTSGSNSSFGQMASHYLQALFDIMQNSQMNHLLQATSPWGCKATSNLYFFTTKLHSWYDIHLLKAFFGLCPTYVMLLWSNKFYLLSVKSTLFHLASASSDISSCVYT